MNINQREMLYFVLSAFIVSKTRSLFC